MVKLSTTTKQMRSVKLGLFHKIRLIPTVGGCWGRKIEQEDQKALPDSALPEGPLCSCGGIVSESATPKGTNPPWPPAY